MRKQTNALDLKTWSLKGVWLFSWQKTSNKKKKVSLSKRHWHHLVGRAAIWIYKGHLQNYKKWFLVYKWIGVNSSELHFQLNQTQCPQGPRSFLRSNLLPQVTVRVAQASSSLLGRSQLYLGCTFTYHLR